MADLVPADKFSRLPEKYQRRAREIAARVADIDALLVAATAREIGDELKRMGRRLEPQPGSDPAEVAKAYLEACTASPPIPSWAVSEAANDYCFGRVEDHSGKFVPHAPEFAKRARSLLKSLYAERAILRTEAEKLIERAADDARRHRIEMERQDPAVRARVAKLHMDAIAGAPKRQALRHIGLSEDQQKRLDAYKVKREPQPSKLLETRVVQRKASGE